MDQATLLWAAYRISSPGWSVAAISWQKAVLYDLLIERGSAGLHTVISCLSVAQMRMECGNPLASIVNNHFKHVEL